MRRGTTPTLELEVDKDIIGWTRYITFRQGSTEFTLENDRQTAVLEGESTVISVVLTQEETLSLKAAEDVSKPCGGKVEVEVRAIKNGTAVGSDIAKVRVEQILLDGVIDE